MMSSYFYPAAPGGDSGFQADKLTKQPKRKVDDRQLSLLDWLLHRESAEPHVELHKQS
jgi:hypothetical protein